MPHSFQDYLALIVWTGRAVREDKKGSISEDIPTILERINIDPDQWQQLMQPRGKLFSSAIGRIDAMRLYAQSIGKSWCQGMGTSQALFPTWKFLYNQYSPAISTAKDIACLRFRDY